MHKPSIVPSRMFHPGDIPMCFIIMNPKKCVVIVKQGIALQN